MKISHGRWFLVAVVVTTFAFGNRNDARAQISDAPSPAPLSQTAAVRVFHVSPAGDDAADGSQTTPWKTIQKAADTMAAGDSVMIAAGSYHERVVAKSSGAEGRPISYIGAAGAIITGHDLPGRGIFNTNGQSYLNIRDLTVRNAYPYGIGIFVGNSKQIRVERCHTIDTADSGIHVDYSSNVVIESNEVEKACMVGGEESVSIKRSEYIAVNNNEIHHTKHEGIDVKEGARHVRVVGNHVHHVERQGLYADAWNQPTFDIRFFNNVVHDCGFGFVLSSERAGLLSDIWFCNNLVYNNKGPGMGVMKWGEEYTDKTTKKDLYFLNNTVVGNGQVDTLWGGGMYIETANSYNLVIKNNIFSGNIPSPIVMRGGQYLPTATIANNLLFGVSNINQPGTGNLNGDPQFVDAAKGDFRLKKSSPARNRGALGSVPLRDQAGNLRDARPDIGAFEFVP